MTDRWIFQTIFRPPRGNCFSACIASLFGVRLIDVPNFNGPNGQWFRDYRVWLARHNAGFITTGVNGSPDDGCFVFEGVWPEADHNGLIVASIPSPRFNPDRDPMGVHHAVVAAEGRCVHDPWPFDDRLSTGAPLTIRGYDTFYPLDPARPMGIPATGDYAEHHEPEPEDREDAAARAPAAAAG
jgi:hypothetical protein